MTSDDVRAVIEARYSVPDTRRGTHFLMSRVTVKMIAHRCIPDIPDDWEPPPIGGARITGLTVIYVDSIPDGRWSLVDMMSGDVLVSDAS